MHISSRQEQQKIEDDDIGTSTASCTITPRSSPKRPLPSLYSTSTRSFGFPPTRALISENAPNAVLYCTVQYISYGVRGVSWFCWCAPVGTLTLTVKLTLTLTITVEMNIATLTASHAGGRWAIWRKSAIREEKLLTSRIAAYFTAFFRVVLTIFHQRQPNSYRRYYYTDIDDTKRDRSEAFSNRDGT